MSLIIIESIDIFSQIKRGTNNVRLLNSAVINQFTMLTYRQPLRAKDRSIIWKLLFCKSNQNHIADMTQLSLQTDHSLSSGQ